MTEEEIKNAIVELLYDLHTRNLLNEYIVNSISINFKIDAEQLCSINGITYNLES